MQTETAPDLPSLCGLLDEPLRTMLRPVDPAIRKLLSFDKLSQVFEAARCGGKGGVMRRLLDLLDIDVHLDLAALRQIPAEGPVVAVANHPFGLLEGAVLAEVLPGVRPDVRILANSLLASVPELSDKCIFIDPFGHKGIAVANACALRECLSWLRRGGMLVAFPAGEVAHVDWRRGIYAEPPWNPAIARIAQIAGATAIPIFFKGANSVLFQLAGAVHSRLRTASLPRELLNKRGRPVEVRIGRPIGSALLQSFPDPQSATEYLRCRTYLLDSDSPSISGPVRLSTPRIAHARKAKPIVAATARDALAAEVARLPSSRILCEATGLTAVLGTAQELPNVLREIGRLREIAFRQVGEGAGRAIDLDAFDMHYLHLFLWNEETKEIAGAYRLGPTPDILPRHGVRGLYTSALFRYRKDFFSRLGPAIELGRSFVRVEYQKQYAPLLLLWKGIGRYVASRPECATLFGAVSISNDYHPISRRLMVKFLEGRRREDLVGMVEPRRAYHPPTRLFRLTDTIPRVPAGMDALSALIADLEGDARSVPILIKQYLKSGGKLLGCNIDRAFSNALDALILVDLRDLSPALLERYMGKSGAEAFSAWYTLKRGAA
jgi:putative hemolysin